MSRRLLELFDGELVLTRVDDILVARIIVPSSSQRMTVLAIEDNLDTLDLWRRYVYGTPFGLVEETHPEQALDRAISLHPALIILDVMMPGTDGWELLREMRSHPALAATPIIVCTVLPQRDLALSLGASDFIQKPATGRTFRATLERQISVAAPPR
jgi:PleD family two-component response regulator